MKLLSSTFLATTLLVASVSIQAESLWDKAKNIGEGAVDTVAGVANTIEGAVSGEEVTPDQARAEIDKKADATLQRLFEKSSTAKKQFDDAVGYAVFDTRKFSFLLSTGNGAGVAVDKSSDQRTYMKMLTGGVNIGAGAKFYQLIFLFPDQATLQDFIDGEWGADTEAEARGGKEAVEIGTRLENGIIVHELTETGLVLAASFSGTRYWKSDDLN